MKLHDFRLLACACVAWALVALTLATGGGAYRFLILALVSGVGVLGGLAVHRPVGTVCGLTSAVTLVLAVTSAAHEYRCDAGPIAAWARDQAMVQATLVVTKEPVTVASTKPGQRPLVIVPARLTQVRARGMSADVDTPVVIVGGREWASVHWRSTADVLGRLRPPDRLGPARATLAARGGPRGIRGPPAPLGFFEGLRGSLRASFAHTPGDARGLTPALVDGDVSQIPDDLKETMNTVGMSHLNAVSGSNVTIVLVACLWVCGYLRFGRRARLAAGAVCLVGFVMLCHPDPSVIRAAAMGAVGILGTSAGRMRAACPALGARRGHRRAAGLGSLVGCQRWVCPVGARDAGLGALCASVDGGCGFASAPGLRETQ